jgi:putative transposase
MAGKREKPEDIVLKLRHVEVRQGQGKSVQEAVRHQTVTGPFRGAGHFKPFNGS